MNLDTIGLNIKKYRKREKLRQEDLAEKIGLSGNYIGMIERGEKTPSLETFIDILNVLNVSADEVLTDAVNASYDVKLSKLNEKIEKLSTEEKNRIYEVVDTMLKHTKNQKP